MGAGASSINTMVAQQVMDAVMESGAVTGTIEDMSPASTATICMCSPRDYSCDEFTEFTAEHRAWIRNIRSMYIWRMAYGE